MPELSQIRIQQGTFESLQQAVRLSPTNSLAQAQLALAALTNTINPSRRQQASSDWQTHRALALTPSNPEVWFARAQVCQRLDRAGEVWNAMERVRSLNSSNAAFWNAWGVLLERTNRVEDALQAYARAAELAGPWQNRQTLPGPAWRNRSNLHKLLGRLPEAVVDNLKALNLSERTQGTPPHLIDLSPYYNRGMDLSGRGDNFTRMRTGRVTLEGIEFDLRGAIQLNTGSGMPVDADTPDSVSNIPIGQKCRRLHFVHVARYLVGQPSDGTSLAVYRIRYVDGETREMPMIHGHHVRTYLLRTDSRAPLHSGTKVAWLGTSPSANKAIRNFVTTWENPLPDVAIESLDFVSSANRVIPFLFAITAEP